MLESNNWTKVKECKLLEWQQQARLHSVCHARSQDRYSKRNGSTLISSISIGAIAVLAEGIALLWQEQQVIFIIIGLVFTAISTILDGVLQATKPGEVALSHEEMVKGYNKIILQIDSVLAKEHDERENGAFFLSKIEEELITLKTGGVKVPVSIWKSIKRQFLHGDLDFQKLDVIGDAHIDVDAVKPPENKLPRSEFKIDDDPVIKNINNTLYEFQMSRLGF